MQDRFWYFKWNSESPFLQNLSALQERELVARNDTTEACTEQELCNDSFQGFNLLKRFIWNKLNTWVLCCQLAAWAMRMDWWKQIALVGETHSNFVWEVLLASLPQSPAAWQYSPAVTPSGSWLFPTAEIPPPSSACAPSEVYEPNRNTSTLVKSDEYLSLTQQTSFSVLELSTSSVQSPEAAVM